MESPPGRVLRRGAYGRATAAIRSGRGQRDRRRHRSLGVVRRLGRQVRHQCWAGPISVAGPYFNLSVPEPTGVVGIVAPDEPPLLPLVSRLAPVIVSGNTAVVLASERCPMVAITLAETLALSDVLLRCGQHSHRAIAARWSPPLAGHVAVDALDLTGCDAELDAEAARQAAATITRVVSASAAERHWAERGLAQSPYLIDAFCETKDGVAPQGKMSSGPFRLRRRPRRGVRPAHRGFPQDRGPGEGGARGVAHPGVQLGFRRVGF